MTVYYDIKVSKQLFRIAAGILKVFYYPVWLVEVLQQLEIITKRGIARLSGNCSPSCVVCVGYCQRPKGRGSYGRYKGQHFSNICDV